MEARGLPSGWFGRVEKFVFSSSFFFFFFLTHAKELELEVPRGLGMGREVDVTR